MGKLRIILAVLFLTGCADSPSMSMNESGVPDNEPNYCELVETRSWSWPVGWNSRETLETEIYFCDYGDGFGCTIYRAGPDRQNVVCGSVEDVKP